MSEPSITLSVPITIPLKKIASLAMKGLKPEDVFTVAQLIDWARENGWVRKPIGNGIVYPKGYK